MKIYTKTGDSGITSLYDGSRVQKSEQIFDVLGSLDELGSQIGVFLSFKEDENENFLLYVQKTLLNIGSIIATPSSNKDSLPVVADDAVTRVENEIDKLDSHLEPLTRFLIMDGKTETSAQAHVCRTVCRRVEREMEKYGNIDRTLTRFMNRLSDYFFTLARFESEVPMNKNKYSEGRCY
jgi:cob(I)alamin adenosyltransferase